MTRVDWGAGRYERTAERLLPAAREAVSVAVVHPGERVLDVGCGTGNAAALAVERGASVTAVEPAERLRAVARQRLPGVEVLEGDAERLPDGPYDVVLSVFAVIFAPDPRAALAEMTRVLAPDGRIVLTAWLPGGAISRMGQVLGQAMAQALGPEAPPPGFAWHEQAAVDELAASLGLIASGVGRKIVFTDASPEAYADGEIDDHPAAISGLALLRSRGVDVDALRARVVEVLREENEDPSAFRCTSRYVVWRLRRT